MIFQEHGDYKVTADGEIILFFTKGSWNLESTTHCISIINSCIEKIASGKFAIAADTRETTGNTPESIEAWMNAIKLWRTLGHGAGSFIDDPNSTVHRVFLADIDKVLTQTLDFKYTDSFDEAIKWFHELGYQGFSTYP